VSRDGPVGDSCSIDGGPGGGRTPDGTVDHLSRRPTLEQDVDPRHLAPHERASPGNGHRLGPADHQKTLLSEVGITLRYGATVGGVPPPGPGLPLPPIEMDFDLPLLAVDDGQSAKQVRPIARDDDELAPHRRFLPSAIMRWLEKGVARRRTEAG